MYVNQTLNPFYVKTHWYEPDNWTVTSCRDANLLNSKKLKVVKKTEISYNFVQIGLKMCKLALAEKLNSVLKLKTGISAHDTCSMSITPSPGASNQLFQHFAFLNMFNVTWSTTPFQNYSITTYAMIKGSMDCLTFLITISYKHAVNIT